MLEEVEKRHETLEFYGLKMYEFLIEGCPLEGTLGVLKNQRVKW